MVFCTGFFPYHLHCVLPWVFPSCVISWKAWCHGMMQCFTFSVLCLLFSGVFSSFILVIPNHIWLLTEAELWINVFTNIFKITLRSLRSNKKFRHTFLYLCLGIFSPLHTYFFTYWIMAFIFRQFNCLLTLSSENFLLLYLASFRFDGSAYICVICELGNLCELIIYSIFHITPENMEQQKRPECRFFPSQCIHLFLPTFLYFNHVLIS